MFFGFLIFEIVEDIRGVGIDMGLNFIFFIIDCVDWVGYWFFGF